MRILLVPYTHQLGSTHTLLELGRVLQQEGHEIIVAGEGYYLKFARDLSFSTIPLIEIDKDKYRQVTDSASVKYLDRDEVRRFVYEEVKLLKAIRPDIVIDTLRPTMYISCKMLGIKRISLLYSPLTTYYKGTRYIPESHFLYPISKLPIIGDILTQIAGLIFKLTYIDAAKPYKQILAEAGLVNEKIDYSDLISGDSTLVFDIPQLFPLSNSRPKSMKFIGCPLLAIPADLPDWFNDFLMKKKKSDYPVVYLSMGSTGALYPQVLNHLIEYSKTRQPIIIVGNSCKNSDVKDHGIDNVYLAEFLPSKKITEYSDVVITHGGKGTIYQSLIESVPLIGIPHQCEQEWNVKRLEEKKLGICVSKRFYKKESLFKALDKILKNQKEYKTRCNTYSKYIKGYDYSKIAKKEVKVYEK